MNFIQIPDNLNIHEGEFYMGYPVLQSRNKYSYISEYLSNLNKTMNNALDHHPRTLAFMFNLHYPVSSNLGDYPDNYQMELFFKSFKSKIEHDRNRSAKLYERVHDTNVFYVYARECNKSHNHHYHVIIFLNNDAYGHIGHLDSEQENLISRVEGSWARALGISWEQARTLINWPENNVFHLNRNDYHGNANFFKRGSYICKAETKQFFNGYRSFGCSRHSNNGNNI